MSAQYVNAPTILEVVFRRAEQIRRFSPKIADWYVRQNVAFATPIFADDFDYDSESIEASRHERDSTAEAFAAHPDGHALRAEFFEIIQRGDLGTDTKDSQRLIEICQSIFPPQALTIENNLGYVPGHVREF